MMIKYLVFIIILFFVQTSFGQVKKALDDNCDNGIKFHYLVVWNENSEQENPLESSREVLVFLDEKSFSEENLKILFSYLSQKYKSPNNLEIRVETDWEKIPNNDSCEGSGISGSPNNEDRDNYYWALYVRHNKDEIFRYNPKLKSTEIKTIVLKGNYF